MPNKKSSSAKASLPSGSIRWVYFLGEERLFAYERSFVALRKMGLPANAFAGVAEQSVAALTSEIGRAVADPNPKTERDALHVLRVAEAFLARSTAFAYFSERGFGSIVYTVFKTRKGGFVLRVAAGLPIADEMAMPQLFNLMVQVLRVPKMRLLYESDNSAKNSKLRELLRCAKAPWQESN